MAVKPMTRKNSLNLWSFLSPYTANGFFLLNAAQFAFRDEPALATYCAQDTAFSNFFAKALEQCVLRLVRAQIYRSQLPHLLTYSNPGLPGVWAKKTRLTFTLSAEPGIEYTPVISL